MEQELHRVQELTCQILDELFLLLGLSRPALGRKLLQPFVYQPAWRFSSLAVQFDQMIARVGFRAALRWLLPIFTEAVDIQGVDRVATDGPLLVVSNHPGIFDSVAIAAALPREDLKIVATGVDFLRNLPQAARHLIYTPRQNLAARGLVIRNSIRHLQQGGAVLIFPGGGIDPDPAIQPGAADELDKWSGSLDVMLKHVPAAQVQPTIASGVLAPEVARSFWLRVFKGTRQRRAMTEFIQVMRQMLGKGNFNLRTHISFGEPIPVLATAPGELAEKTGMRVRILASARRLLAEHLDWIKRPDPGLEQ